MSNKKVLVIAGPTGVGESTITRKIIEKYPIFKRLVTATTRKPRLNEKNKIDYYFFNKEKFLQEIKNENIIEHTYVEKRDVYYGSYKPDLDIKLSNNFNIIMNPDLVGAKYYKENYNATTIFLMPESIEIIEKRLIGRDPTISNEELEKRLFLADAEIKEEASFYDYTVYNKQNKLEEALDEIFSIINKENYRLK